MTISKRLMTLTAGLSIVVAAGSLATFAQEPASKKTVEKADPTSSARKKYDPSRRVPDYFGQIGLTIEQRESIYKLRKAHHEKIDALKKQIDDQEAMEMRECEALLTETQKKLLENLRTDGARGTTRPAPPAAKPASK